ncbi:MAG: hypothetical protein OSB41_02920, partial [Kiritimatiellae bacterium]|nr:hypothetical protein [Kiritimatiellia bacterium]
QRKRTNTRRVFRRKRQFQFSFSIHLYLCYFASQRANNNEQPNAERMLVAEEAIVARSTPWRNATKREPSDGGRWHE